MCKVSKESTDWWLYAPNWIMGKNHGNHWVQICDGCYKKNLPPHRKKEKKTTATIKTGDTQQARKYDTGASGGAWNAQSLLYCLVTTAQDTGRGHRSSRIRVCRWVQVCGGVGQRVIGHYVHLQKILESLFLRTYKVVVFIDTSAHSQLQC